MDIKLKLYQPFMVCWNKMKDKYGESFERINGFHNENLNFSDFIDHFTETETVADASIDANANSSTHDIRTLMSDMVKPHTKLLAYNKIFYELTKKYGIATAEKWLELEWNGAYYLHDAYNASFIPYCYAYDVEDIVNKGLFFINKFKTDPPKHLTTYNDHILEFVSWAANRTSGAVGMPSYLVYSYYFWHNDVQNGFFLKDPEYYRRQCFQKFIYDLNQPYLRVTECAFTNITVMDRNYLIELFGGRQFPNGEYVIDHIDEIIEHQKVFMEVVSEIREKTFMTFPVLTYSLLYQNGKFVDEDFARWCNKHNMNWYDSNFYVGADVTSLSNCPLSADTKILYLSEKRHAWIIDQIKDVYQRMKRDDKTKIKMMANGKVIDATINRFEIPIEYKITLQNGAELKTTANHLNVVYGKGSVETKDLTTEDYLPYGLNAYDGENNLTYDDGFLVGMFLGDGSLANDHDIVYSLGNAKSNLIEYLHKICPEKFGAYCVNYQLVSDLSGKPSCTNVVIHSHCARGLIEQFVSGNNALEKGIKGRAFQMSVDFRRGIIDGIYATDGGNNNRIYTSSARLKDDLVTLCATLGRVTNVTSDSREGRLGENPCYCVRVYSQDTPKQSMKDVYIKDGEYMWMKIKSIEKLPAWSTVSYCVQVLTPGAEPIFTLANGIITHNCRLVSDTSKLDAFINSIGGTSLSIGSLKVNTINLRRIALESGKDEDKYIEILHDRIDLCLKVLATVRHIIKRNVEKGLLPNYTYKLIDMEKQYCTIGITAMYETMNEFGYIDTDELGYKSYSEDAMRFAKKIMNTINEQKESYDYDFSINVECIPAERANVVLCDKDNLLYPEAHQYYIYSNQWIPLVERCTIDEKIRLGAALDKECGGGQISHINVEGRFANEEQAWELLNKIAAAGVIYFAYNTKISVCENEHGFFGDVCPHCGKPVADTYSRVVGFLTPRSSYSKQRKKEFDNRKWYQIGNDI